MKNEKPIKQTTKKKRREKKRKGNQQYNKTKRAKENKNDS